MRSRLTGSWIKWAVGAVSLAIAVVAIGIYLEYSKRTELKLAQERQVQEEKQKCAAAAKDLRAFYQRWTDALALASSTPRLNLSGRIADLQKIRHDANSLSLPGCADGARNAFSTYMVAIVDGLISFLASPDTYLPMKREDKREMLWELDLELRGLEGCMNECRQRLIAEWNKMKELEEIKKKEHARIAAIEREKFSTEFAIKNAQDKVRTGLYEPSSARFQEVILNQENGAVCGQVIAINGHGVYVQESFAVNSAGEITIGRNLSNVNVGAIAAKRLCGEVQRPVPTNSMQSNQPKAVTKPGEMRGSIR